MTELLFDREWKLRQAALAYAEAKNEACRKALRQAAINFADICKEIDAAAKSPEQAP